MLCSLPTLRKRLGGAKRRHSASPRQASSMAAAENISLGDRRDVWSGFGARGVNSSASIKCRARPIPPDTQAANAKKGSRTDHGNGVTEHAMRIRCRACARWFGQNLTLSRWL